MSRPRGNSLPKAFLACAALSACIELNKPPPDGTAGSGGNANGGSAAGGKAGQPTGGVPALAGDAGQAGALGEAGSAGRPYAGAAGAPISDGGTTSGGTTSGGTTSGGTTSGGTTSGGTTSGGLNGDAGDGGASATSGGASPVAGSPGLAGAGGAEDDADWSGGGPVDGDDRCGIGVLDPAAPPTTLPLSGSLIVHDPAVIASGGRYYLLHTGARIPVKVSTGLTGWSDAGTVFASNPEWIGSLVSGVNDLWAPDVSRFGGSYHLYYSASTFGSNRSCIGHATRASLSSGSWVDQGPVICSNTVTGVSDDWNAIDPNLVQDGEGVPWLAFGSFWTGIKLIRLDLSGARADTTLHALAERATDGRAIEAPFITRRCGYYYLFASFDYCCRGSASTYRIMVGRSTSVLGPYTDRTETRMLDGAGSLLVQGNTRWRGPGHNTLLFVGTAAYNLYHSYDSQNQGQPTLRIAELRWDEQGWPVSGGP
jgi:arabinan endo-1,5-alpha-L-arabinosidase